MKRKNISNTVLFAMMACSAVAGIAQEPEAGTTVTAATGTIRQLNYDAAGAVQGFLIGTNILLTFPSNVCGGISTLGVVGNAVTYSGTAVTVTSGFQSVRVTSFTNNTTKASYTHTATTPTAYGPTGGTVKQLNYETDGAINGFLFAPSGAGASIFVYTGSRASATLTPLLTVGGTVSVTGTTSVNLSACAATATLMAVDASSLTVGGQTIVIAGSGKGGHR